jgi:hypothetical protein
MLVEYTRGGTPIEDSKQLETALEGAESKRQGKTGANRETSMVTNYPQQLTATAEVTGQEPTEIGLLGKLATRLGRAMCGLHGHDSVLHFEGNRVMMRCTSCGYDSPGWEVSAQGPRLRYEGDARRHSLNTPRLVLRKSA